MIGFDAHGMLAPVFLPAAFLAPERIATLRLASAGFVSAPGDTPALAFYEPRILEDRAGSGNLNTCDKCIFCLRAA